MLTLLRKEVVSKERLFQVLEFPNKQQCRLLAPLLSSTLSIIPWKVCLFTLPVMIGSPRFWSSLLAMGTPISLLILVLTSWLVFGEKGMEDFALLIACPEARVQDCQGPIQWSSLCLQEQVTVIRKSKDWDLGPLGRSPKHSNPLVHNSLIQIWNENIKAHNEEVRGALSNIPLEGLKGSDRMPFVRTLKEADVMHSIMREIQKEGKWIEDRWISIQVGYMPWISQAWKLHGPYLTRLSRDQSVIHDLSIRHKCILKGRNESAEKRPHSIDHDGSDGLIDHITKANWPKMIHLGGFLFLRDENNVGLINLSQGVARVKETLFCIVSLKDCPTTCQYFFKNKAVNPQACSHPFSTMPP